MIKTERLDRLRKQLGAQGMVTVTQAADELGVSEMTIRRDLDELVNAGEVERIHGGARVVRPHARLMVGHEFTHAEKRTKHFDEKRQIATAAVALVEPDSTIFLGAGTTTEQMAALLPEVSLRVVTNSLSIFNLLEGHNAYELCLVGGMYRRSTAAFVGPMAEDTLRSIGVDAAFIGANGVLDDDIFTSNMEEGRIQQLVFGKADARYLITDSSKIGKRDFYSFYRLSDLDALICEPDTPTDKRAAVEEYTRTIS